MVCLMRWNSHFRLRGVKLESPFGMNQVFDRICITATNEPLNPRHVGRMYLALNIEESRKKWAVCGPKVVVPDTPANALPKDFITTKEI